MFTISPPQITDQAETKKLLDEKAYKAHCDAAAH
jgi:hypothetical protein